MKHRYLFLAVLALALSGCQETQPASTPLGNNLAASPTSQPTASPGNQALAGPTISPGPTYRKMCDGSAGIALDEKTLAMVSDEATSKPEEKNIVGLYPVTGEQPVLNIDLTSFLAVPTAHDAEHPETDFEAAARVGERIYWIGSHGRNKTGKLRLDRQRFFATDIKGAGEALTLVPVAKPYVALLQDITSDVQLKQLGIIDNGKSPNESGFNIEGLCATPDGKLMFGLRGPLASDGNAFLVPMENAAKVIESEEKARFGKPFQLDLGKRGIRDIAYSETLGAYLIIAGPFKDEADFRLYRWSGKNEDAPVVIKDKTGKEIDFKFTEATLADFTPEAVVIYPKQRRVQILSDDGDIKLDGVENSKQPDDKRFFRSVWLTWE